RQLRNVARESTDIVVVADDLDLDRQLSIEIRHDLGARGLEQLELQATPKTRLVDVRQQRFHLRAIGQLLQHGAERLLDVGELFAISLEIDRLALLVEKRVAQRVFFCACGGKLVPLSGPVQHVTCAQNGQQQEQQHSELRQNRPCADVARIEPS